MPANYSDFATKVVEGGNIVRIDPGALIELFISGTATKVSEVVADANGFFEFINLDTGKYDVKVQGKKVKTINHIPFDHTHPINQAINFFFPGSITADQAEASTVPCFGFDVAGTIEKINITAQHIDATGDLTVHLLKGIVSGSTAMTIALNSIWNVRLNPGSDKYRYAHFDPNVDIELSIDDAITIGLDYSASTVSGISVTAFFRSGS